MQVTVHRLAMASPADVSGLESLIAAGALDPGRIVAIIGKTEGNGGANDFTRALATLRTAAAIGSATGEDPVAVAARVALVWSGGCEGVLSPHMTVIARDDRVAAGPGGGLAVAVARTRDFRPEEVGRMPEVEAVAAAAREALAELAIEDPGDVHYVQVKGPLLTPAGIKEATSRGASLVTTDPNESKAYARGATALAVAIALGEVDPSRVTEAAIVRDRSLFSRVASTSAGGELTSCEIIVFANSPLAAPGLRIGHGVLRDAIDARGVIDALGAAGLNVEGLPSTAQQARIAAVFAKATVSASGEVRGRRTTMLSDADISVERHARAAVGAVIASVTGDPAIFVSGGTEHQGAPGEAPIAVIVRDA